MGFCVRKLQSPVRRRRGELRFNEIASVVVRQDHVGSVISNMTRRRFWHEPERDKRKKNMRSDMVPVDSARPAVESISNGPAFELKRIAESAVERALAWLQSRSTNRRPRFVEMQLVAVVRK